MAHVSLLHLLKDVPLSPSYTDTFAFASVSDQTNYFMGKRVYSFTDMMYIKPGLIQLPNQEGKYLNCNYLMWQNPDVPGKWFYGFITDVSYISDGTTQISYTEDFLQTWYFSFQIPPCFVEREHVNNDGVGANLKEESVAIGAYVTGNIVTKELPYWSVMVSSAASFLNPDNPSQCDVMQGTVSGLSFYAYTLDDTGMTALRTKLDELANLGKSDAVVDMWVVPSFMIESGAKNTGAPLSNDLIVNAPQQITVPKPSAIDGYTPRNNKLLTYPYVSLEVSNRSGQAFDMRFEFFSGTPTFTMKGTPMPSGRVIIRPLNYENMPVNLNYTLSVGNYPHGAWIKDVYSNWLATEQINWDYDLTRFSQTSAFKERQALGGALGSVAGGAARGAIGGTELGVAGIIGGGIGGAIGGAIEGVTNLIGLNAELKFEEQQIENEMERDRLVHQVIPPAARGSVGTDTTQHAYHEIGFSFNTRTITSEYARSIDDYFDMFGYRTDRVKTPNVTGRQSWNYVKTLGCVVRGTCPLYAKTGFSKLLNQGIRFWHTTDLGNYSLPNGIV